VDTTVIPPHEVLDAAVQPYSLASLGSVLAGTFCPECDRDVSEPFTGHVIVLCETCAERDEPPSAPAHG
jgi:hypothetical protein